MSTEQKPKDHHLIQGLEVTGGFLKNASMTFADGLNCIIGGRGTGKTTILEFIRYTLGMMPKQQKGKNYIHNVVQSNLADGTVRLTLQTRHGMHYTAERPWNEACQVLDEDGKATSIVLDNANIFQANIFSQNQIEQIATNPDHQLMLIDRFKEDTIRDVNNRVDVVLKDIHQYAEELIQLEQQIDALEKTTSDAKEIQEKLTGLQQLFTGESADKINTAHHQKALRDKEVSAISGLHHELKEQSQRYQSFVENMVDQLRAFSSGDILSGDNKEVFQEIETHLSTLTEQLQGNIPWVAEECQGIINKLEPLQNTLAEKHAIQEQQYRELVAQSQEEQSRIRERAALQKRHLEVSKALEKLQTLKKKHQRLDRKFRDKMDQLSTLQDERYQLRQRIATQLSQDLHPIIRVTITQAGDCSKYSELLVQVFQDSGIRLQYNAIVEKIVQQVSPRELATIVQRQDSQRLTDMIGLDSVRAEKVINILIGGAIPKKLAAVELSDLPKIELKDGESYKTSSELSTGQRCTTILPILLLESERPLLIDQPEDNLDNAFIYQTIVKSVKEVKKSRQLIFVTHNPNIPVLGDAERVFMLHSDGKHSTITHQGSVDEVREQIEQVLEGGREAFLRRKQRYGH